VRARHARRPARLFHHQDAYVFNGLYQQKFVQVPIFTWQELRRIAVRCIAYTLLMTAGLIALAVLATRGAR
jgi:hypothetical protein